MSEREQVRLILVMAPSFQGGHSGVGDEIAKFLDIPFPIRMDNLAKAARARNFDPDQLWPWWLKMRQDAAAVRTAERRAGE